LVKQDDGDDLLCRGIDRSKDQSYVLFGIDRPRLKRMLLPVGNYHKPHIRNIASKANLKVAHKRDSQEICFVPAGQQGAFVQARRDGRPQRGNIVTTSGDVVGQHEGVEFFTIGQRKGLGVAMGEPYFVVRIDARSGDVVIGRRDELARHELTAGAVNWLVERPNGSFRCLAQIRYNSSAVAATAELLDDSLHVSFDEPCFGVAPGQAVVCYHGDQVLGGGWIE
jgi:tRNA-specific 2-thiouridylase